MRRYLAIFLLLTCLLAAFLAAAQADAVKPTRLPKGFFGIAPQTALTDEDAAYMRAGGIESVRWPVEWAGIQPTGRGEYRWGGLDDIVAVAARHGLTVLPFFYGTPGWVAASPMQLPIDTANARKAWAVFLEAAVERYGPGGEFWNLHAPGGPADEPPISRPLPIRRWQIWNEANFYYFAFPASPRRYADLLRISSPAIKAVDPGAKVILTGLFGRPTVGGSRGMPAARFLERLYRSPGITKLFDGIALHPYAANTETLEELVEELHQVTVKNEVPVALYITEMGWGSESDLGTVAFERGVRGQVRELRGGYRYLLRNRSRFDLKQVFWFSWKDVPDSCNFCDSVGFFRAGPSYEAKPAWSAFVSLTGGRASP